MLLAAFDLETSDLAPESRRDWPASGGLGIACAGVACSDDRSVRFWRGGDRLTRDQASEVVRDLEALVASGHTIVTWNGCKFDFRVLAEESGLGAECAALARSHVDLMMTVTFAKGWFVALDKALQGAALPGKLKCVRLRDGTPIEGMCGAMAPGLWSDGECDAVLAYLGEDVARLLDLAEWVAAQGRIRWLSRRGYPQEVLVPALLPVDDCFQIARPDTTWMDDPPLRSDFVEWMPCEALGCVAGLPAAGGRVAILEELWASLERCKRCRHADL